MAKTCFNFDFLSPFSYFAWENHKVLKPMRDEISYQPVLMGQLFDHWGIKGPGEIPPKRLVMLKNCFRYASKNGIPFTPPTSHPFNPLYVLRLATSACSGAKQFEVIDALWSYIWGQGRPADDPEQLESYLNEKELPGSELMEKAFAREAKLELKANTKKAIENKVFGVPSFVCEGEVFWGNDSLEYLMDFLKDKESFDRELFQSRTADIKL